MPPPSVALVSNLNFPINGRDYGSEDRLLAQHLSSRGLDVQLVLPETLFPVGSDDTHDDVNGKLLESVDAIFCRNNYGGVLEQEYRARLDAFYRCHDERWKVFNDFGGCKGDYCGKQHLLDLYSAGYPVIPSSVDVRDVARFGEGESGGGSLEGVAPLFMVKSMTGADSNGIQKNLTARQVTQVFANAAAGGTGDSSGGDSDSSRFVIPDPLLQPMIDFQYEVSFVFFEGEFMYAMSNKGSSGGGECAPELSSSDAEKRWSLCVYDPTEEDMAFAWKFVRWNDCSRQIQRVDACRLTASAFDGEEGDGDGGLLLLMEVEDYNCWLSLGDLLEQRAELFKHFVDRLAASLQAFVARNNVHELT